MEPFSKEKVTLLHTTKLVPELHITKISRIHGFNSNKKKNIGCTCPTTVVMS